MATKWCKKLKVALGSSIKFQGHTGWKIDYLNPIWVRLLGRSQLSNPSDLPCCFLWSMTKHKVPGFLGPEGFRLLCNVTFGVYPYSGTVPQEDTGYSWEATLGILSLPLQDSRFPPESFSNHGNKDLWPRQRGQGQTSQGYSSTSFLRF